MKKYTADKELLDLCKKAVAKKFKYENFSYWVHGDYLRLSDAILEITKTYLSPTSLKRFFGKINHDATPLISTLNILAQYLEYTNWPDFVAKNKLTEEDETSVIEEEQKVEKEIRTETIKKDYKKLIWIAIGCAFFIGIIVSYFFINRSSYDYKFSLKTPLSQAPYSAVFNVDISKIQADSIILDFNDHFETEAKYARYSFSKPVSNVTHSYVFSGIYHPQLIVDGKIIDSLNVPVFSNGWECVVVNYHESIRAFYAIKDKPYFRQNGIFCIPASEVASYKVDTMSGYCLRYRYFKQFNVQPDNISLEIKACNPIISINKCSNIEIQLKFEKWNIGFMLFQTGCIGNYARVLLGSNILNGINNDLSMFGVDLNQWQTVLLDVKNNTARISINNKIIFEGKVEGKPGSLIGVSLNSLESARFDYIRLRTPDKVLLSEEF